MIRADDNNGNAYGSYTEDGPEQFEVDLGGLKWIVERDADLETLWDEMVSEDDSRTAACPEFADDERLPYWTEVWPASILLARWCAENKAMVQGQRVLDLGCGLGLIAMVAASLGGRVVGMDYEHPALVNARRIAGLNASNLVNAGPLNWVVMDWRKNAFLSNAFPLVLCGDIMYESRFGPPLARFLSQTIARDGRAVLAEPSRDVFAAFRSAADSEGLAVSRMVQERVYAGQVRPFGDSGHGVTVNLWEITLL